MTFAPRLDILPTPQRRLWVEFAHVPRQFTLYGGTAIALHLGHRASVGFDFFGFHAFDPDHLYRQVPFLKQAEVIQRDANTLTCLVDREGPVQVSFFGVPGIGRVREPHQAPDNGLLVADLIDLAGMKASVVQKRAMLKDYIDMDAMISHGVDLSVALAAGQAIYGTAFSAQITLKALLYFEDGNLRALSRDVRQRLLAAVRAVDLDKLPTLHPVLPRAPE